MSAVFTHIADRLADRVPLSDYDRWFVGYEYGRGPEHYRRRLEAAGIVGRRRVLDAGCGVGQWTYVLAQCNDAVCGIDASEARVDLARHAAALLGGRQPEFRAGRMEALPYETGTFDAVVCIGAWMFAPPAATLAEFRRVLAPGGRLYLQVNGPGWPLRAILVRGLCGAECECPSFQSRAGRWNLIKAQAGVLRRTLAARMRGTPLPNGVCFSPRVARELLDDAGFDVGALVGDGQLAHRDASEPRQAAWPFYPGRFLGLRCVYELIADARTDDGTRSHATTPARAA